MAKNTKERILEAALDLFSKYGYSGTNIQGIADSVGLVKSALYRHFSSKEEIWKGVYEMTAAYYREHFGAVDRLPPIPKSGDELIAVTKRMVDFTVHDEKVIKTRKILTTEQFRDEKACKLASDYFIFGTRDIFTAVFTEMMANGSMKQGDAETLAFSYTAPISALIHLCDREPVRENEAMEIMQKFIECFINTYCCK